MKRSNLRPIVYIIILVATVAGTLTTYLLPTLVPQVKNITILVVTILLDILSMGYFIVQDIIGNRTTISKYGSLSLFETVDCEDVSKMVFSKLASMPSDHVIYINCNGLNNNAIENVKQKLYEDLTNHRKCIKKYGITKNLNVKSVYVPASLDIESLYESVFYNANKFASGISVYIYDKNTANEFFVKQIDARLKKHADSAKSRLRATTFDRTTRSTYLIYLTDNYDESHQIKAGLSGRELREMVRVQIGKDYDFVKAFPDLDIKNVLTLDDILHDCFYKKFIDACPPNLLVIYHLKTGEYLKAMWILSKLSTRGDRYNRYLWADTLHLLNLYHIAYTLCIYLANEKEEDVEFVIKTKELLSHIAKHMGIFTADCIPGNGKDWALIDSNSLMEEIKGMSKDAVTLAERKIAVNNYFFKLTMRLEGLIFSSGNYLREDNEQDELKLLALFADSSDPDQKMYYAAFSARENPTKALKIIEDIIEFYEKTENRRRFNAYYVKAEVLRIMNRNRSAYDYYLKSSGILDNHHDVNLLDQNYFSLKALERLGLVSGLASQQVREYKSRYYTVQGARTDESKIVKQIRTIFPGIVYNEDTEFVLQFNNALLHTVDSEEIDNEALQKLLMDNVFIIL